MDELKQKTKKKKKKKKKKNPQKNKTNKNLPLPIWQLRERVGIRKALSSPLLSQYFIFNRFKAALSLWYFLFIVMKCFSS